MGLQAAEGAVADAASVPAAMGAEAPPAPLAVRRSRLFRKYFVLVLALVTAALLIPSTISLYFSRIETLNALHAVQQEKGIAAASRIEQYYTVQVQGQLRGALLPQLGDDEAGQRRLEFLKLLKQVPDVTDLSYIAADGCEKLQVSRLRMDANGPCLRNRSSDPAFARPTSSSAYYGPVYFRKDTEPYMEIAVRSSERGPVAAAEVNLKFMWDVVTRIRVGERGKAYVVDSNCYLIAHPDIGLVLRKSQLCGLEQVRTALEAGPGATAPVTVTRDAEGVEVLSAHAAIAPLGWHVFVEQPADEVFARLHASLWRTGALLLGGLVMSALAALFLARGMARPIRTLEDGAKRIGAGQLDHRIDVRTGDELEALAGEFNRMTAQLRESYAGLERKVEVRTSELTRALDQQTAISEILRVISASPTDVQPVLEAVAERAAHLCDAPFARVLLVNGDSLVPTASYTDPGEAVRIAGHPVPYDRSSISGRAAVDRQTVHHADVLPLLDSDFFGARENIVEMGIRAVLAVPLMREGGAYGSIFLFRPEPRPFAPDQIALVETFARQAAIAIDNVRLFNETREALDQQRASGEVLAAISSSIADAKPVFDVILASCQRLFAGHTVGITLVRDDGMLDVGANAGHGYDELKKLFPQPLARDTASGLAILERRLMSYADIEAGEMPEKSRDGCRALGAQSVAFAPMLYGDRAIGTLWVARAFKGPFPDKQIALLRTFADQAVIAIQNARLVNETREALDQQRASGEVLSAISSSIADTKPVFDAILQSCERLFEGMFVGVMLVRDGMLDVAAYRGPGADEWRRDYPMPIDRSTVSGTAILERRVVDLADANAEDAPPMAARSASVIGFSSLAAAPMIVEGRGIGALWVGRSFRGSFGEKQLALLKTFADQAVIAIENARLVNETREALEQQTATAEVLRVISRTTFDLEPVVQTLIEYAARLAKSDSGQVFLRDGDHFRMCASCGFDAATVDYLQSHPVPVGPGSLAGRTVLTGQVVQIEDAASDPTYTFTEAQRALGYRSMLGVPMFREGEPVGAVVLWRREVRPFGPAEIRLASTFADQAVIAVENVRLLSEIREKSRELEIANQHKSEFLANMSHELRTPLNAIIGFSEVLLERMFGELNDKQDDYLKDILASGRHLLMLINDILDLSKVEAGRMELELSSFHVPTALSNAMTLVRERAQRHAIALGLDVDPALGEIVADERKFKQIMLNLLSNAVKFTPDGGRVDVIARRAGSVLEVAVRDTGIGIAKEDHDAVFEEFRQVGRHYTNKHEGTGLGLTLTRRFVELHGGRIRVDSVPGQGATFTFTLPCER